MAGKRKNFKKKTNINKYRKPKLVSIGPYFPPKMLCKHKFQHVYALAQSYNDSAGGFDNQETNNFRLNGLYDVDTKVGTGTGGQPRLYDEMSQFYDTYKVVGAKAYIKFINLSEEPVYVCTQVGGYQLTDNGSIDLNDWREMKNTTVNILHGVNSGPKSVRTIVRNYSPAATEGITKTEFKHRHKDFSAMVNAYPTVPHYLSTAMTQVSSTLGGSNNTNVQVELTIHFTVEWSGVKLISEKS